MTMSNEWVDFALEEGQIGGLAPFILGAIVAAALIGAVVFGWRVRQREPRRPTPEEQPKMPPGGPVREDRSTRDADDVPRADHDRLTPHQLDPQGTVPSEKEPPRPRWNEGSSGGFGSGGGGHR